MGEMQPGWRNKVSRILKPVHEFSRQVVRWWKQRPTVYVVVVVPLILTIAIEILFHSLIARTVEEYYGAAIAILVILTSVLILVAQAYFYEIHKSTLTFIQSPAFVGSSVFKEDEVAQAYERMREAIEGATEHVYILSAAFPNPIDPHRLRLSAERPTYLQSIEKIIDEKLEDVEEPDFKYTRVLQSDSPDIANGAFVLTQQHIDRQTFDHCYHVWQKTHNAVDKDHVKFDLFIREPVLSCPSILVVDKDIIQLALVGERKDKTTEVKGMITLVDHSDRRAAARHYIRLITALADSAIKVEGVED
jgi:hypothetical protein